MKNVTFPLKLDQFRHDQRYANLLIQIRHKIPLIFKRNQLNEQAALPFAIGIQLCKELRSLIALHAVPITTVQTEFYYREEMSRCGFKLVIGLSVAHHRRPAHNALG